MDKLIIFTYELIGEHIRGSYNAGGIHVLHSIRNINNMIIDSFHYNLNFVSVEIIVLSNNDDHFSYDLLHQYNYYMLHSYLVIQRLV